MTVSVLVSCRRGLWHTGTDLPLPMEAGTPKLALSASAHRVLTGLLAEGIVGRVSHGMSHLPPSQRYHVTSSGTSKGAGIPGFETP